jgi:YfiH family protein
MSSLQTPPFTMAPSLAHFEGISHGFFGSQGGVSTGLYTSLNAGRGSDDAVEAVAENRARIAAAVGAEDSTRLISCHQHHSSKVVPLSGSETGPNSQVSLLADAMVTREAGLALAILTADCVPILFADETTGVIGATHSGWKGAIADISTNTLEAMEALGADRSRICAAVGPCIGQASYEVGPEFRETFLSHSAASDRFFVKGLEDRFQFDIQGFVYAGLVRAGVCRIDVIAHDTCALDKQYFSNRRRNHQGLPDYGRNASVIMLKPE